MTGITELRHTDPGSGTPELETKPDHLAAILDAMRGEVRVRTVALLGRLAEFDPAYGAWTSRKLTAELELLGVAVKKTGGNSVVLLDHLEEAVSRRDSEDK